MLKIERLRVQILYVSNGNDDR